MTKKTKARPQKATKKTKKTTRKVGTAKKKKKAVTKKKPARRKTKPASPSHVHRRARTLTSTADVKALKERITRLTSLLDVAKAMTAERDLDVSLFDHCAIATNYPPAIHIFGGKRYQPMTDTFAASKGVYRLELNPPMTSVIERNHKIPKEFRLHQTCLLKAEEK